jgi:hypothetical protein
MKIGVPIYLFSIRWQIDDLELSYVVFGIYRVLSRNSLLIYLINSWHFITSTAASSALFKEKRSILRRVVSARKQDVGQEGILNVLYLL